MKNLFLAIALTIGLTSFAQNTSQKSPQMSAQQQTDLRVKELTLKLDLNATQQKEMTKLIAEQQQKREAYKAQRLANKDKQAKMTADEKYALKSKMLDEKIAFKNKLKTFLTPAQLEKWEKTSSQKGQKMHMMKQKKHRKTADDQNGK